MDVRAAMRDAGTWLVNYGGNKLKETIRDKILEELGLKSAYAIFTGDFPAAKLAGWTVSFLKWGYFSGFYSVYSGQKLNPYNPRKPDEQGPYAEYLLYSSQQGEPGYIYALAGFAR